MYLPKVFEEKNEARIHDLIDALGGFGALVVGDGAGSLEISSLPFVLDRGVGRHGRLRAHVARANPIWKLAQHGCAATVIFSGPHGYVSPRWYESPREQVPTWNYMAVHASGRLEAPMDRAGLLALVDELSSRHEAGAPEPWRTADLEEALRDELLDAIVGLELRIDRLEAKVKMSQNRSPEDRARVMRALRERGGADDVAMATWMERE
jgi:transcriptional regulator